MRQVVFADNDFDIHAEIVFIAENLNHAPSRILCSRWPIRDLNINDDVFKIGPFGAHGYSFAQYAMFGFRRWSFVVGRSRKPRDSCGFLAGICAKVRIMGFCQRRTTVLSLP